MAAASTACAPLLTVCASGARNSTKVQSSLYWSPSNASGTQSSALSYIPEVAWNESGAGGLWASGGGASTLYAKPSWQTGTGVPADGKRDVPDVSLTSAGHDGYLIYQNGGLYVVGGTSAAAPSFAGVMALVVQHSAARQGNANTTFYSLASKQRAGGASVFHDITSGNNSVPGQAGFTATVDTIKPPASAPSMRRTCQPLERRCRHAHISRRPLLPIFLPSPPDRMTASA